MDFGLALRTPGGTRRVSSWWLSQRRRFRSRRRRLRNAAISSLLWTRSRLLVVEDLVEAALLQRRDVDRGPGAPRRRPHRRRCRSAGRAHAGGRADSRSRGRRARRTRRNGRSPMPLRLSMPVEAAQRVGVLRADAVDQDLVELAHLAPAGDRERQHVPERKAEIVDDAPRAARPGARAPDRGWPAVRRDRGCWRRDRSRRRAARSAGRACAALRSHEVLRRRRAGS